MMPGDAASQLAGDEDGIALMSGLKARWPDLLCIAMTGQADFEVVVATMHAGFDYFLVKPIGRLDLHAALERASSKNTLIRQRRSAIQRSVSARISLKPL